MGEVATRRGGAPQYSPRRGPGCLPFAFHGHSVHGRATPLSEEGNFLAPTRGRSTDSLPQIAAPKKTLASRLTVAYLPLRNAIALSFLDVYSRERI